MREAGRQPVGELLREWRERRRLSQLDLAIRAEISARHLSFVETGRSRPTAAMILRLTEQLAVPLRERNVLLLAGGYAPDLLTPPVDVLRLSLHPDGMAPRIANLGQWRAHLLTQLRHRARALADDRLAELHAAFRNSPSSPSTRPTRPRPRSSRGRRLLGNLGMLASDRKSQSMKPWLFFVCEAASYEFFPLLSTTTDPAPVMRRRLASPSASLRASSKASRGTLATCTGLAALRGFRRLLVTICTTTAS
jgi:transcriptional regulator with XRE-family HTH domain